MKLLKFGADIRTDGSVLSLGLNEHPMVTEQELRAELLALMENMS